MSKLPPADQAEIIRLYRRGLTLRQVAAQTYWSTNAVRNVLVDNDEPRRRVGGSTRDHLSTEDFLRTSELYGAGLSMREISILDGINISTVHRRLHRIGSIVRPCGGKHPGQPRPLAELRRLELQINRSHGYEGATL